MGRKWQGLRDLGDYSKGSKPASPEFPGRKERGGAEHYLNPDGWKHPNLTRPINL